MYRRILVALDHSDIRSHVIQEAIALSQTTNGTLNLLHVLSPEDEHAPGLKEQGTPDYERRWAMFEQEAITLLEHAMEETKQAAVFAEQTLRFGTPSHVICATATHWNADVIVIGRRRLSALSELFLGSVSHAVVHAAPCSVLVVQGNGSAAHKADLEKQVLV